MIDHATVRVADIGRAARFYDAALAPLGLTAIVRVDDQDDWAVAYGDERPFFWLGAGGGRAPAGPVHIAFVARDRAAVDAFHRAGLAAGGRDNGAPGLRQRYEAGYYAAFLFDPDGNNIEAVCHEPGR